MRCRVPLPAVTFAFARGRRHFREFERAATTEIVLRCPRCWASILRRALAERAGRRAILPRARDHAIQRRPDRHRGGPRAKRRGRSSGPGGGAVVGTRRAAPDDRPCSRAAPRVTSASSTLAQSSGEIAGPPLALPMLAVHTVGVAGARLRGGRRRGAPGRAPVGGRRSRPRVLRARRYLAERHRREPRCSATRPRTRPGGDVELDREAARKARSATSPTNSASTTSEACAEGIRPRRRRRNDPRVAGRCPRWTVTTRSARTISALATRRIPSAHASSSRPSRSASAPTALRAASRSSLTPPASGASGDR